MEHLIAEIFARDFLIVASIGARKVVIHKNYGRPYALSPQLLLTIVLVASPRSILYLRSQDEVVKIQSQTAPRNVQSRSNVGTIVSKNVTQAHVCHVSCKSRYHVGVVELNRRPFVTRDLRNHRSA